VPGGSVIVMLTTDRDIAAARGFRQLDIFAASWRRTEELARRVPPRHIGTIATFPAFTGFIDRAAGPSWIAVGDALIVFDPLTSSGIAGALSDAFAAAPAILAGLNAAAAEDAARAYGRYADATLKRYLRQRRQFYNAERRWPGSPFWARRASSPDLYPIEQARRVEGGAASK